MDGAYLIFTLIVIGNFSTPSFSPVIIDPQIYRSIIEALQYVTIAQPNITFAINRAYQFMYASTEQH